MTTNFYKLRDTFRTRWKPEWKGDPSFEPLLGALNGTLSAVTNLCGEAEKQSASGRFSKQGLTEEIKAFARLNTIPVLQRSKRDANAAREQSSRQRSTLAVPKADPSDITSALLRAEMRTWLRSLPRHQTAAILLKEPVDERLLAAVLEAPAPMSGLSPQVQEEMQTRLLKQRHAGELERLSHIDEAAAVVDAAVETGFYEVRRQADFDENNVAGFSAWVQGASSSN